MAKLTRKISWIKAAQKDFKKFPATVREKMESVLTIVAEGQYADSVKPLKGFGAGVYEISLRYRTDAYRTVYALKIGDDIWVVHAFKKKSKSGIKTTSEDINLIKDRVSFLKERLQ